jgi:hypothetical protein
LRNTSKENGKKYTNRYPTREEEQHRDIRKAILSMLNCRRYLRGQGFSELFPSDVYLFNNNISNISGCILFPDSSKLNSFDFREMEDSLERDALLEQMIEKEIAFKRNNPFAGLPGPCSGYDRDNVIRTSFSDRGYNFTLSVIDTTREGVIFPINMFMYSPKKFSFQYDMTLRKKLITDHDLEEFARYQQGLDEAMRQNTLSGHSPQTPQRGRSKPQEVEVPKTEKKFINPWSPEIDKVIEKARRKE